MIGLRKGICRLLNAFYHIEVEGKENLRALKNYLEEGSAIIVFNHLSLDDIVILLTPFLLETGEAIRKLIVPASRKHFDLKRCPRNALAMRLSFLIGLRLFPIVQHYEREKRIYSPDHVFSLDRCFVKATHRVLAGKGGVLIFAPEGTRSKNGKLQSPQKGIEFLLRLAERRGWESKLFPAAIEPKGKFSRGLNIRREFVVHFAPPLSIEKIRQISQGFQISLAWVATREIAKLLPSEYLSSSISKNLVKSGV